MKGYYRHKKGKIYRVLYEQKTLYMLDLGTFMWYNM